ncbi:hypothetical protein D3C86_1430000 [compost metagenome]
MTSATFRFYQEFNDFLPAERRRQSFTCECARFVADAHLITGDFLQVEETRYWRNSSC